MFENIVFRTFDPAKIFDNLKKTVYRNTKLSYNFHIETMYPPFSSLLLTINYMHGHFGNIHNVQT